MSLSEIRVNTTKTRTGVGTITYTETGPVITGIATASNFKTGSTNVHSTGVELANINTGGSTATFGGPISGTTASFSGSVSIGGTLTYEDVTNIDSVGVITARNGLVSPNADIDDFVSVGSNIHLGNAGVVTATSFVGGLPISNGANNRVITASSATALQGESALTYSGGTLEINAASPQLTIAESDTTTSSRLVMSAGRLYIQVAQQGQGSSTSSGIMYLTGYNNTTASEIHLKANNTYNIGNFHLTGHLEPSANTTYTCGTSSKRWSVVNTNVLSAASYAAVGSIVAADPGSNYYSYNNRIGSGLAIVGTTRMFGNVSINNTNSTKRFSVKETTTSSGVYYNAHIGGSSHLTNYAVGIGFDPEGYPARVKIGIVAEGTSSGYSRGKLHFLLDSANDSGEATLSESRMTILDSGNVGIGIVNPVGSLEVRDSKANLIVAKDGLTVKSNSDLAASYDMIQLGAGGALASYSAASVTADTMFIHNAYRHSGNDWKRRYADTAARMRVNSPANTWIFETAATGSADSTITSWSESLRINSSGHVGINETNPNRLLYISDDSNTAYSSTSGSNGAVLRLHNKNGTDNNGVNNQVGIEMYVANGATTVGMLSMVRTGNNTGDFTYKSRINASNYKEHFRIKSTGVTEVGSGGNYGSSPGTLNVGSRATDPGGVSLNIARGEAIGGGTGPLISLVHGPDSGTQRVHNIYSYIGDLRVFADTNENLELRGTQTIFKDNNNNIKLRVKNVEIDTEDNTGLNVYGGSINHTNDAVLYCRKTNNSDWAFSAHAAHGSGTDYGMYTRVANGASYALGVYDHNNSSWRFRVSGGGGVFATNTTLQSISDQRLKENIVDANSQWNDIKALRFRNFKWKADSGYADGKTYLGLIAQEVEPISPNLVEINAQTKEDLENEVPDPEYKNVKYSIVWMKAMKALQEAQVRIETLEAKVAALEGS